MGEKLIKIDKGVPLPKSNLFRTKYPFATMEVGDSFVVSPAAARSISGSMSNHARRNKDTKFTRRRISDTEIRIWRVK